MSRIGLLSLMLASATVQTAVAQAEDRVPGQLQIRQAIEKSIPLIETASAGSARERKCFTCHNQALAVLVLDEARQRGFKIDQANFQKQIDHTVQHLKRGLENYRTGKGQGGGPDTASYALWTLELAGHPPDEVTTAVTGYLLERDKDHSHWNRNSTRPPSMSSHTNTNYFVIRALQVFGSESQQPEMTARIEKTRKWLLDLKPDSTEERVFQLRCFQVLEIDDTTQLAAIDKLLELQNPDGGWSQTPEMQSDAYATGTVMVALMRSHLVNPNHPSIQKSTRYLIETQQNDGSWRVVSHAKPFQTYYETGFPGGKDQFISVTASSWATVALLLTQPRSD